MTPKTSKTFSADLEADKDILAWCDEQENFSAAMRALIREHIQGTPKLGDVLQEIRDLSVKVEAVLPGSTTE